MPRDILTGYWAVLSPTAFYICVIRPKFRASTAWKRPNRKDDKNAAIQMPQESVFNAAAGSLLAPLSDPQGLLE